MQIIEIRLRIWGICLLLAIVITIKMADGKLSDVHCFIKSVKCPTKLMNAHANIKIRNVSEDEVLKVINKPLATGKMQS